MLQVGDAVRVVPGTGSAELLEPWADLTGSVAAVHPEDNCVTVSYPEPFPGFSPPLPAGDFCTDTPLDGAPF